MSYGCLKSGRGGGADAAGSGESTGEEGGKENPEVEGGEGLHRDTRPRNLITRVS